MRESFTEILFCSPGNVPGGHHVLRLGDQEREEDVQLSDSSLPAALAGSRSGGAGGQLSDERQHLGLAQESVDGQGRQVLAGDGVGEVDGPVIAEEDVRHLTEQAGGDLDTEINREW